MGCGASKAVADGVSDDKPTQNMTEVNAASQTQLDGVTQSQTIETKGGMAFDITLDEPKKHGELPSLQGAAAAADKLKNADALLGNQEKGHNKSNSALGSKSKLRGEETDEDIDALRQRIEEKEAQAAANRARELEKMQEKLAKADEHVREVQERKKQQSNASLNENGASDDQ